MARSPKSLAIESALRHQSTRQTFLDAFNAPVGSTKRKNASLMLKGISKTAFRKFSGMGGPDSIQDKNPWSRFTLPVPSPSHPMKRAPRIASMDGKGGASGIFPTIAKWAPSVLSGVESFGRKLGSAGEVLGSTAGALTASAAALPEYGLRKTGQMFYQPENQPDVKLTDTYAGGIAADILNPEKNPFLKAGLQEFSSPTRTSSGQASQAPSGMKPGDIRVNDANKTYTYINNDGSVHNGKLGDNYVDNTSAGLSYESGPQRQLPSGSVDISNIKGPGLSPIQASPKDVNTLYQKYFGRDASTPEMQNWQTQSPQQLESFLIQEQQKYGVSGRASAPSGAYETGNGLVYGPPSPETPNAEAISNLPSALTGWDRMRELVGERLTSGLGPQSSAIDIMNDPVAMAELQKLFPGVPKELLPKGATLAGQLNDLAELKKKEFGLDEMNARMKNLVTEGVSLQADLTDFVRGKDEYITHIDKLLNDAQTNILGRADAADPRVRGEYTAYVNYLTTLKGRQTKRYTDVLNDSIDQHNKDLQQLETVYQDTLTRYNDEIAKETSITQEVYTQMYNSLTELYTQLATAGSNEYEAEMKYQELVNQQLDNAKLMLELQNGEAESGSLEKGVTYAKSAGFVNSDTGAISGVDVLSGVNDLLATGYDATAARGFVSTVLNAAVSELTAKTDPNKTTEDALEKVDRINKSIGNLHSFISGDYSGVASGLEENQDLFNQLTDILQQYLPIIQKEEENILSSELSSEGEMIKKALVELLGKEGGFLGIGGRSAMNFEEWKNSKTASKLPPTIVNMLERIAETAKVNGTSIADALGITNVSDMSDSDLTKAISNAYTSTLF